MKRRITIRTLENKLKKWQTILKLDGWNITAKFVPQNKLLDAETTAQVESCFPSEKVAVIIIYDKYLEHNGYNVSWNIDTLIIHELIHVLLWEKTDEMPASIQGHSKFKLFEEFLCDSFAKILFDTSIM